MHTPGTGHFRPVLILSTAREPEIHVAVSELERNRLHSALPSPSSGIQPLQREPPCERQNIAGANRTRHARKRCMPGLPSTPFLQNPCATRALATQLRCLPCWNPSPPKRWSPVFAWLQNLSSTARNLPARPSPPWSPQSSLFPS